MGSSCALSYHRWGLPYLPFRVVLLQIQWDEVCEKAPWAVGLRWRETYFYFLSLAEGKMWLNEIICIVPSVGREQYNWNVLLGWQGWCDVQSTCAQAVNSERERDGWCHDTGQELASLQCDHEQLWFQGFDCNHPHRTQLLGSKPKHM